MTSIHQEIPLIDLYTWSTPNGRKVSIMLEELALGYNVHPIDIGKGDQFAASFAAISPSSKIPAIVDSEGPEGKPYSLFESGAILLYLAEKSGRLLPRKKTERFDAIQWLMFQMGSIGPMFGQVHHFLRAAPQRVEYAIERYGRETRRLYAVTDRHLAGRDWLASEYSVADIATYPWVARHEWHKVDLADFPNVKRWFDAIGLRPAVQQGMKVPIRAEAGRP